MMNTETPTSAVRPVDITNLPAPLLKRLNEAIVRIRRIFWLRGGLAVGAVALVCILCVMAIDASVVIYSTSVRWGLTLCAMGVTGAASYWFLVRRLRQKLDLDSVARLIESRYPDLDERLSSTVELVDDAINHRFRGSEQLLGALVQSTDDDFSTVDAKKEFTNRTAKPYAIALLAAACILILLLVVWPRQVSRLLVRAVAPSARIGNLMAGSLTVEPGDVTLALGEPLIITAFSSDIGVARAELHREDQTGKSTVERMGSDARASSGTQFSLTFPSITESFRYRVRAGGALSAFYRVNAVLRPAVTQATLIQEYPAYTGRGREETDVTGNQELRLFRHARSTLAVRFNKPLVTSELRLDDAVLPANEGVGGRARESAVWPLPVPPVKAVLAFHFADANSFTNVPRGVAVVAVEDQKPAVQISEPLTTTLRLRPGAMLPVSFAASDDYGLRSAELVLSANGNDLPPVPFDQPGQRTGSSIWEGRQLLALGAFDLSQVKSLEVRVRVFDNLPAQWEGPQSAISAPITITLDNTAESVSVQIVAAQEKQIREALGNAIRQLEAARKEAADNVATPLAAAQEAALKAAAEKAAAEKAAAEKAAAAEAALKAQAAKDAATQAATKPSGGEEPAVESPEVKKPAVAAPISAKVLDALDAVRLKLAPPESGLRELSRDVREGSFARLADDIKAVADTDIREAREAAQAIPLQDDPEGRKNKVEAMTQAIDDALSGLQDLGLKMDETAKQVKDVARMADAANREYELARQLDAEDAVSDAWRKEQDAIAKEFAEMVRRTPEAAAKMAERDREAAAQLADSAGDWVKQQDKLQDLASALEDPAQRPLVADALRKELQRAQERIADKTRELQSEIQGESEKPAIEGAREAVRSTRDAAQQLDRGRLDAAAEQAGQAASDLDNLQKQLSPPPPKGEPSVANAGQEQNNQQQAQAEQAPSAQTSSAQQAEQASAEQTPSAQQAGELGRQQEQVAQMIDQLKQDDLAGLLEQMQKQLAAEADAMTTAADELSRHASDMQAASAAQPLSEAKQQMQSAAEKGAEAVDAMARNRQQQSLTPERLNDLATALEDPAQRALIADAMQKGLQRAQERIADETRGLQREVQRESENPVTDGAGEAVRSTRDAARQLDRGRLDAAAEKANQAASDLDNLQKQLSPSPPDGESPLATAGQDQKGQPQSQSGQSPSADAQAAQKGQPQSQSGQSPSADAQAAQKAGALGQQQEQMAQMIEQLRKDDLTGFLEQVKTQMAGDANAMTSVADELSRHASDMQATSAAQPLAEAKQPLQSAPGKGAEAGNAMAQNSQQSSSPPSDGSPSGQEQAAQPSQGKGSQSAMQQASAAMQQAAQKVQQASQAMAAASPQASPEGAQPMVATNPDALASAYDNAASAMMAATPSEAATKARSAANAMAAAASQTAMNMGMPLTQAMPSPEGQSAEEGQPGAADNPGQGNQGRRMAVNDGEMPVFLQRLGGWFGKWSLFKGSGDSQVSGQGMDVVKPEYRGLVKQYFEEVSRRGAETE